MNVSIIADVIPIIHHGRFIHRTNPHDIDAERFDVVEFGDDTGDVAHAIVIGVKERRWVDLVDGSFFPPGAFERGRGVRGEGGDFGYHCGGLMDVD